MGRQKIEIKKIECATKLRATYNKRSRGIIKKVKELGVLCDVEVEVTMFSPTGKRNHYSNRQGAEQPPQQLRQNAIPNMLEEERTNLKVSENAHMPMPIQQTEVGSEAGMCANHYEEFKVGRIDSHFLESEDPSLSAHQIMSGQVYRIPCTSSSPGMQGAQSHMPMQQHQQGWAAPNGSEPVKMQRDPSSMHTFMPGQYRSEVTGSYGMPFSNGSSYNITGPPVQARQMPLDGGASDNMMGPLVGASQMPFTSGASDNMTGSLVGACQMPFPGGSSDNMTGPLVGAHQMPVPGSASDDMMGRLVGARQMHFASGASDNMMGQLVEARQMPSPCGASDNMMGQLVGACQMVFPSAAQPSSSRQGQPEGETSSNEDPPVATLLKLESGDWWMNTYD